MRFVLLLSMGSFCMNYAMDNREEPVVCGSVTAGYCMEMVVGRTRERLPLMENRGNIQEPPEPIEVQTCRDCYMHNKKKIWCCGACCCMTCTCMTINSLSSIVKGIKTMTGWCFGE